MLPLYYINLKKSKDRRAFIKKHYQNHKIVRIKAYNGDKLYTYNEKFDEASDLFNEIINSHNLTLKELRIAVDGNFQNFLRQIKLSKKNGLLCCSVGTFDS